MNRLSEFLTLYSSSEFSRFHTPGHKGNCDFINNIPLTFDITEIKGSDSLYHSNGIISNLEDDISNLYGSQAVISASGSTLCIQTMLSLIKNRNIVAMRESHISFYNTCALLDISPIWIKNSGTDLKSCMPTANDVEAVLLNEEKPCAVYITSPNYYGISADIAGISNVCKKHDAILVIDNAHGAHLKFTSIDSHPLTLGADMCCDSLHKTLPTLTGAAVLHTKHKIFCKSEIKDAMAMFGSTSPSYLIMHSIGLCADWLKTNGKKAFFDLELKKNDLVLKTGVKILKTDCSKLTIDCSSIEKNGIWVAEFLRSLKIEPEYADEQYVVLMLSAFLNNKDWAKLEKGLFELSQKYYNKHDNNHKNKLDGDCGSEHDSKYCDNKKQIHNPKRVISMRQAYFKSSEKISVSGSKGRIAARCEWACPPGIPIVAAGELIDRKTIDLLISNNIKFIDVIKK